MLQLQLAEDIGAVQVTWRDVPISGPRTKLDPVFPEI